MALAARARGKSSDVCFAKIALVDLQGHTLTGRWAGIWRPTFGRIIVPWCGEVWALSTWKMAHKITKSTDEIYYQEYFLNTFIFGAGTFEEWLLQIVEHATWREKKGSLNVLSELSMSKNGLQAQYLVTTPSQLFACVQHVALTAPWTRRIVAKSNSNTLFPPLK